MKTLKSRLHGFTLVELIVVIAIIGVLAAILVPAMSGYLRSSRYRTANANAKEIYIVASGYCADYVQDSGSREAPASTDVMTINSMTSYTGVTKLSECIDRELGEDSVGTKYVVVIKGGNVARTYWSKTSSSDDIIGSYPIQIDIDAPQATKLADCVGVEKFASES